jgi:hypothetical protein
MLVAALVLLQSCGAFLGSLEWGSDVPVESQQEQDQRSKGCSKGQYDPGGSIIIKLILAGEAVFFLHA